MRVLGPCDVTAWQLAVMPYFLGYIAGFSRDRRLSGATAILAIMGIVVSTATANSASSVSPFQSLTMGAVWLGMGTWSGGAWRRYMLRVGLAGAFYTVSLALISVSAAQLLVEAVLPLILGEWSEAISESFWLYLSLTITGLLLFRPFSRIIKFGWKPAAKKILYVFTAMGLVELVAQSFWDRYASSLMWFMPGLDPPVIYGAVFSIAASMVVALPTWYFDPQLRVKEPVERPSVEHGLEEAIAWGDRPVLTGPPLKLIPFEYDLPSGWRREGAGDTPTEHQEVFRPPTEQSPWWKARPLFQWTVLRLFVKQYPDDTKPEAQHLDRLRRNVGLALAERKARPLKDEVTQRHGVVSYECMFEMGSGYGRVITFVKYENQFVIYWTASDPYVFREYLADVDRFATSFRFKRPKDGHSLDFE
jgi:hypothetical protein